MGFSFKFFDIYGTPFQFTFLRKDLHKTHVGGLLSFLRFITIIESTIYFGKNFFNKTNPNYIYKRLTVNNQSNYIVNNTNLYLAIQIRDYYDKNLNISEYFDVKATYYNLIRSNLAEEYISKAQTLKIVNCSEIDEYETFYFSDGLCINFTNLKFGGYFDRNEINFISLDLNYCLNQTYCKNITEIKNFLNMNKHFFNVYTTKTFIYLYDKQNLAKQNIKKIFSSIETELSKSKFLFFSPVNVTTDYGILTEMKKTENFLSVDGEINDFFFLNSKNLAPLVNINLFLNTETDDYTIIFIKVQAVFASLGGIFSFIKIFFSNIAYFFNFYEKKIIMVNKLYDFSNLNRNQEMIKIIKNEHFYNDNFDKNSTKIIKDSIKIEKVEKIVEISNQSIDDLSNEFKKKLKEKKKKFYLNPSFINFLCGPKIINKSEEIIFQLYSKANNIIEKKLDIIGYLKFFEEYVLIKQILLDDFSNLTLTLRNRPKLYENNNFVNIHLPKIERLKRLIELYAKNRNSLKDSKYFKIFDDEIKINLKTKFIN